MPKCNNAKKSTRANGENDDDGGGGGDYYGYACGGGVNDGDGDGNCGGDGNGDDQNYQREAAITELFMEELVSHAEMPRSLCAALASHEDSPPETGFATRLLEGSVKADPTFHRC